MKEEENKKKSRFFVTFASLFLGHLTVDTFNGSPFTWGEYFMVSFLAMLIHMFFSWAWNSKEYRQEQ